MLVVARNNVNNNSIKVMYVNAYFSHFTFFFLLLTCFLGECNKLRHLMFKVKVRKQ